MLLAALPLVLAFFLLATGEEAWGWEEGEDLGCEEGILVVGEDFGCEEEGTLLGWEEGTLLGKDLGWEEGSLLNEVLGWEEGKEALELGGESYWELGGEN